MNDISRILPVLDLRHGQVVRGIAGRRSEYRPIQSNLTTSVDPIGVATALRNHFGFRDFYLADLDAIESGRPNRAIYEQLFASGFHLWIDAGLKDQGDVCLDSFNDASVIVGLESVNGPDGLRRIKDSVGAFRAVFSLDLNQGLPLGKTDLWPATDTWSIARHAIEDLGVKRLIVLDLANVGVGEGVGTEDLCKRLKSNFPAVQLTTGGGVRGLDDVHRLTTIGVDRVLVASALHDGRLKAW